MSQPLPDVIPVTTSMTPEQIARRWASNADYQVVDRETFEKLLDCWREHKSQYENGMIYYPELDTYRYHPERDQSAKAA
jgi:hypothetical protein